MARRRRKPRPPRLAPGPNPPRWSRRTYLRLAARDLALFKFILESYDNLAYLTVVDKYSAIAQLVYSPGNEAEVRNFLDAMRQELEFTVFEPPPLRCANPSHPSGD